MKKIRVLHVLGGLNQGGVENLLMNIYTTIDKEKIQFDFLVNREGFFDDEVKKMGGKIYYIPALQSVGEIKYRKILNDFYKEHQAEYQIVHSHLNQVSGLILELAHKNNIPVRIAHGHNNAYSIGLVARIYKEILRKKIDKYATHLFACSNEAAIFMFHQYAKNAYLVNNGVPVDKFKFNLKKRQKFRSQYGISENAMVLGHVGRFEKQKNHEFLIRIFDEYYKLNSNSYLIMVGEGTLKEKIKLICQNKSWNNRVIFVDPTSDIDQIYCGMDIFVFPSLYEGLGMVLVEAQISGLPTYASQNVIPKEVQIVSNFTFLNLEQTPAEWASHIMETKRGNRDEIKYLDTKNPYDILNSTSFLQKFYIEHSKKGR